MSIYQLHEPKRIGDWNVFPDATLSDINMADCNDTISGVCVHTDNLQQCLERCDKDEAGSCLGGYFLRTQNRNFCVPLRGYANEIRAPYDRIRNKNNYPIMKNLDSEVFINNKAFPYPPDIANGIYYKDHFTLSNKTSNLEIGMTESGHVTQNVTFTNFDPIHLQALPVEISESHTVSNALIKHGDDIVINVPDSAMILKKSDGSTLIEWLLRATAVNDPSNAFTIFSTDPKKKIGEPLNYDEDLYLMFQNSVVIYDTELKQLRTKYQTFSNAMKSGEDLVFKFQPQVKAYYCNNDTCTEIELEDAETNGIRASKNGKTVFRSPGCLGICSTRPKKHVLLIVLVSVAVLLGILLLHHHGLRKRH